MKPSKYNYYLPWEDGRTLFFNGLTKRFFFVSKANSNVFREVINDPDNNEAEYRRFIMRMNEEGFIVHSDKNELSDVKNEFRKLSKPHLYRVMVLPTLQCNVRCWYCVQKHTDVSMSQETLGRLKKHISSYLSAHSEIKELQIAWFGGEPALRFDVIDDLNTYAINLCNRLNISFSSGITTNGLLLNEDKIKRCRELNISGYQITIDGIETKHNKVKIYHNNSAFKTSLNNLANILKLLPEATCLLRINYTPENLEPEKIIAEINSFLPKEYRHRITVYPIKVWQIPKNDIDFSKVDKICKLALENGYRTKHSLTGWCYVSYHNFNCFYPNGKVGKCDNDELEDAKGFLDETGHIIWKDTYPFLKHSLFEADSECNDCKYLPFCYGPCPQSMDRIIKKNNQIKCYLDDKEEDMPFIIYKYVKTIMNNLS